MWLCRRLGIVRITNGHKRGTRRFGTVHNNFSLYHWGEPSLYSHPCDWRDDDPNASVSDPAIKPTGEHWEYLGNIFDMLPYAVLTSCKAGNGEGETR